ncbi:MAG: DNA-binding protein [Clostridia bacterium]|nr:DNA-binding protein [Clostridia bacterium]
MIVVSDTTPLISLIKASQLGLLEKLYGEVLIPRAVYGELTANTAYRDEADTIINSPFNKVVEVQELRAVDVLQRATGLDLGESEAIVFY